MKPLKLIISIILISLSSCRDFEDDIGRVETIPVSDITSYSARGGGNISPGDAEIVLRGVCWSRKQNPTLADAYSLDGEGPGAYISSLINLNADTVYYVRSYFVTESDTVYGQQIEFSTPDYILFNPDMEYGKVTDIDGNEYKTVKIGTQTWMAENLKTTRFRNGEAIPHATDPKKWGFFEMSSAAYCWYDNDERNKDIYGALYNWYAATDSRNIAPEGWRVPTGEDWQTLFDYLKPAEGRQAAILLKERSTAHWIHSDPKSPHHRSNEHGLTVLPGGKTVTSEFIAIGQHAYYWTSDGTYDFATSIFFTAADVGMAFIDYHNNGYSIRCIKNE